LVLGALLAVLGVFKASALTTFTYQLYNSDGTPFTNTATMIPWPVTGNSVVVYGSSIVFAKTLTLAPNGSGAGSVAVEPNTYRVTYTPATGGTISFYINIPDTTNTLPLAAYVSNSPAVYTTSSLYAFLTNGLGYAPVPATAAAITNLLGTVVLPAPEIWTTNTPLFGGVTSVNGLTNRLATNSSQLLTLTLGNAVGGITGSFGYTNGSGGHSTFYVTNGIVITNTTP
jgi:hypothetical protein